MTLQPPPPVFAGAPPAVWIAPPNAAPDSFAVFRARRAFALPGRPARFVVHVSADHRYRLFVNGAEVSSGPQRSDLAHWRYETVDLAPHLRAGPNVVAALVWHWGAARPVAQHGLRAALLVQGDGPAEAALVNTGPGWRLLRDSSTAPLVVTSAALGTYYAAAPGDSVDGRRVPWGWERPEYADTGWLRVPGQAPNATGGASDAPPVAAFDVRGGGAVVGRVALAGVPGAGGYGEVVGWQLAPRSIPPLDETPERFARVRRAAGVAGVAAADGFVRGAGDLVVPRRTRATLLLDRGRTTNAFPELALSGGAGARVALTYAEALVDSAGRKGHRDSVAGRAVRGPRDVFVADGGARRTFRPLHWRAFRYAELAVETRDAPLRLHDVRSVATGYPLRERARWAGDLPWLADLWRLCGNAARLGAADTYMDTPYYEQLQYVGDTRVQALLSYYLGGDDRLARQAIEHFDWSRTPDGLTQSRYPSSLPQVIPPFSLVYVLMVHDFHRHRGDPAFVRARLAGVRGVLDWYARRVDATGLPGPTPHWNYVDWTPAWDRGVPPGADAGHSVAVAMLYAHALRGAAELEADVGAPGLGAEYRARADALVAAARRLAWDPARGLFRDAADAAHGAAPNTASAATATYSQQTNALAVLAGAVPGGERRAVMARVLDDRSLTQASYYFRFYLFEAMREAGLGGRYVGELGPWRDMLALGLTSTPENPEPTRSDTHAWSAHPAYGLLATVLGVRPAAAGFASVRVDPALGPLARAEGRVPHPRGDVDVRVVRAGRAGVRADVTLPAGVGGEFVWGARRAVLRPGRQTVVF